MLGAQPFYMDQSVEHIPDDQALSFAKSSKDRRLQYDNVIKRKNRTLLTDKSTRRVPDGGASSVGMAGS